MTNYKSDDQRANEDWINALETISKKKQYSQTQYENYQRYNKKFQVIIDSLKSEFLRGDPYVVWIAVYACEMLGCNFPDWVRKNLAEAASELIKFENPNKSYADYVASVFKLSGHKRRGREKISRDSGVRIACKKEINKGKRRVDTINKLAKDCALNIRQVESIYDQCKKRTCVCDSFKTNNISSNKVKLFSRNT